MAAGFVRKWLGGGPPPGPEVQEALAQLERARAERPSLAGPLSLLADILPGLYRDAGPEPVLCPASLPATDGQEAGTPLLRRFHLPFDDRDCRRRWHLVCSAVDRHQGGMAGRALVRALKTGRIDAAAWTREVLAGRPDAIVAQATAEGLDPALSATVLRLALFPWLSRVNLLPAASQQADRWDRGYCPTCGSRPLLGEFRGLEQTRFLRCGLCAADWSFPRLACPYCGNRDHHTLGFFHVEGEEGRLRCSTCDRCRGYVKMVSTLAALSGPGLLAADVATTHLDLAAADRSFGV